MSQPPQDDFSSKLTDALIKLFIVGSGGWALYFLYIDALPKAMIAGAVSAGAALLTSFGEGLMDRLKGGMKRQGEIVGDVTTEAVGTARDLAWARLSGLSRQYQEAMKAHCYAVEVEGFQDLPGLALEDVFVPLRIESTEHPQGQTDGPKQIWDFLPKRYQTPAQSAYRRMVILADPGYGKTTLMRHLTLSFVTDPPETVAELMPILLRFREVHDLMRLPSAADDGGTALSLPDLVLAHLKNQPEFQAVQPTQAWLKEQLTKGTCLVMFDGLDEVPKEQKPTVRQWVDDQMKRYSASQFIITSRPHGFELQADDPSHPITVDTKLKVLDFTPDQKQDFVEKWYRTLMWRLNWEPLFLGSQQRTRPNQLSEAQARRKSEQEAQTLAQDLMRQIVTNPPINDLARNPLLITMIASTHRAQTVLPKRRVELYDKIFDLLLGTRPYAKKTPLTLTASQNRVVLQELAWKLLMNEKATQFTPQQCQSWITNVLGRCTQNTALSPQAFLKEMTDIAGLVVEKKWDTYEFSHLTFQEYLAARYLRERGDGETLVKAQLSNPAWEEVVCFFAALGDATPILEALLSQDPNDYRLRLAQRCLNEGREVKQTVATQVQTALEAYVAANPLSALVNLQGALKLQHRFQHQHPLTETATYHPDPITWGEYKLFLDDQQANQFHSWATVVEITPDQEPHPVTGISWQDAQWFCAWLSTQTTLQPDGQLFDYRLPTPAERAKMTAYADPHPPFTTDPTQPGHRLVVVRHTLPERYASLVNYLANGRWRNADEVTYQVMRQVVGGILTSEALREFPCDDLHILDHLWVKHSGGKFGFSVQKQIYVETGNPLDGEYHENTWEKFSDRVGWRKDGNYLKYDLKANPSFSPAGKFPFDIMNVVKDMFGGGRLGCSLLSHRDL